MPSSAVENVNINLSDTLLLARGLLEDGHYEQAERLFRAADDAGAGFQAIHGLGICLNELERSAEALPCFDRAYAILRDEMIALSSNRARALTEIGRCEEALQIYDGLLRSSPNDLFRYNRALTLLQMGRYEETISACDDVLSRDKTNDKARFARGFARLVLGDYERGFEDYECRLKDDIVEPDAQPWTGNQDLSGKTILVYGEMGLGDNIMFARYLPMMVERGARVVAVVPDSQKWIVESTGVEYRTTDRSTWPQLDYWVRFMSLALCFKTTRKTVPGPPPILFNHDNLALWRNRILGKPSLFRVGLCWAGSSKSRYDKYRTVPLRELTLLTSLEGCRFYSLQKELRHGDEEALSELKIVDLGHHLATFEDTACAMRWLDLVITVDTSVAHMAGTVGVPTWVLLTSFRTYWLWINTLTTSPWYPSARIFRQQKHGDWSSTIGDVASRLKQMAA